MNIIPRNSRFTFSSDVFPPFGKLVKFNSAAVKPSRLCSGGVAGKTRPENTSERVETKNKGVNKRENREDGQGLHFNRYREKNIGIYLE